MINKDSSHLLLHTQQLFIPSWHMSPVAHSARILSLTSSLLIPSSVPCWISQIHNGSYWLLVVRSLASFPGPQMSLSFSSFKHIAQEPFGSRLHRACHAVWYFSANHFVFLSNHLYRLMRQMFGLFLVPATLSLLNCQRPWITWCWQWTSARALSAWGLHKHCSTDICPEVPGNYGYEVARMRAYRGECFQGRWFQVVMVAYWHRFLGAVQSEWGGRRLGGYR